jgi:hypothetical protein
MVRGPRWLKFSWWWGSEPPGMWGPIRPGRKRYRGTGVKTVPRRWRWVGPWGRGSKIRPPSRGGHWTKRWLGVSSVLLVGITELWSVILRGLSAKPKRLLASLPHLEILLNRLNEALAQLPGRCQPLLVTVTNVEIHGFEGLSTGGGFEKPGAPPPQVDLCTRLRGNVTEEAPANSFDPRLGFELFRSFLQTHKHLVLDVVRLGDRWEEEEINLRTNVMFFFVFLVSEATLLPLSAID